MRILKSLAKLLTLDLTGKTWKREVNHPYFGRLVYFGSKSPEASYWEAELQVPGEESSVGVTMTGTTEGPTKAEEEFCKQAFENLDLLFDRCRAAFEPDFLKWAKHPLPKSWRGTFKLNGLQIPLEGRLSNAWELCYFVEPANHYFTAVFENGKVSHVAVDG